MSDDLVGRADEALQGVTDGPWEAETFMTKPSKIAVNPESSEQGTVSVVDCDGVYGMMSGPDARFIVAARELVPELRDALRDEMIYRKAAETQEDTYKAELDRLEKINENARLAEVWDEGADAVEPYAGYLKNPYLEPRRREIRRQVVRDAKRKALAGLLRMIKEQDEMILSGRENQMIPRHAVRSELQALVDEIEKCDDGHVIGSAIDS